MPRSLSDPLHHLLSGVRDGILSESRLLQVSAGEVFQADQEGEGHDAGCREERGAIAQGSKTEPSPYGTEDPTQAGHRLSYAHDAALFISITASGEKTGYGWVVYPCSKG